jgi:hypothetical protein
MDFSSLKSKLLVGYEAMLPFEVKGSRLTPVRAPRECRSSGSLAP